MAGDVEVRGDRRAGGAAEERHVQVGATVDGVRQAADLDRAGTAVEDEHARTAVARDGGAADGDRVGVQDIGAGPELERLDRRAVGDVAEADEVGIDGVGRRQDHGRGAAVGAAGQLAETEDAGRAGVDGEAGERGHVDRERRGVGAAGGAPDLEHGTVGDERTTIGEVDLRDIVRGDVRTEGVRRGGGQRATRADADDRRGAGGVRAGSDATDGLVERQDVERGRRRRRRRGRSITELDDDVRREGIRRGAVDGTGDDHDGAGVDAVGVGEGERAEAALGDGQPARGVERVVVSQGQAEGDVAGGGDVGRRGAGDEERRGRGSGVGDEAAAGEGLRLRIKVEAV